MTITLRPYQESLIEQARDLMRRRVRSILIQAPTGSGKTALTAAMLRAAVEKGSRAWFLVHRAELIQQSEAAFQRAGVPHGIIAAGYEAHHRWPVQICSVQTLVRRLDKVTPPNIIVTDECHHVVAGTWAKILGAARGAYHIGLTATPCRMDGRGLGAHYDAMILGPSVESLIRDGFLADYDVFAPQLASTAGIHTRAGDYAKDEIASLMDTPTITGDAVAHYRRLANGKRAIAFCTSIKHSKSVAQQFCAAGIVAEHVDGETPRDDRLRIMDAFRAGHVRVVCNVDLFGEGVDVPAIEAAILLRPTKSLGLYMQQVGRALRPSPGKAKALILDHVGAVAYHGLPDDPHEWTLDGVDRGQKKEDRPVSVKICPKCYRAVRSVVRLCACGHSFVAEARPVSEVAGELHRVDKEAMRRQARQEQGQAQSLQDLEAIGFQRYGQKGLVWARIVWATRKKRRRHAVA